MDTRRRDRLPGRNPAAPSTAGGPRSEATAILVELGAVPPPRRGPGTAWLAAMGLGGLAGVVVVVGLLGDGGPSAQASHALPTQAASTTRPVIFEPTGPVVTPAPWSWAASDLLGYGRGSSVANIWALGDLFVLEIETDEGPDGGPYGPVSSVLLASRNGVEWSDDLVDLPLPGFAIEAGGVSRDGRMAVLGHADGQAERQLWFADEGPWIEEGDFDSGDVRQSRLVELAFEACGTDGDCSGAGLLAIVGIEGSHEHEQLLVSRDGVDWAVVDLGLAGPLSLRGLARGDDAWYVLATHHPEEAGHPVTSILVSADLVSWRSHRFEVHQDEVADLVVGVAGPVAVGSVRDGEPSPRAWLLGQRGGFEFIPAMAVRRPPAAMHLLAATSQGYAAMNATTGDAWHSLNGGDWINRPAFEPEPGDTVMALASSGEVVVAGGRSAGGRPRIWSTTLEAWLGLQ